MLGTSNRGSQPRLTYLGELAWKPVITQQPSAWASSCSIAKVSQPTETQEAPRGAAIGPRRAYMLAAWVIATSALFWQPLRAVVAYASENDDASHIFIIPLLAVGILYLDRARVFRRISFDIAKGAAFAAVGASIAILTWWKSTGAVTDAAYVLHGCANDSVDRGVRAFLWAGGSKSRPVRASLSISLGAVARISSEPSDLSAAGRIGCDRCSFVRCGEFALSSQWLRLSSGTFEHRNCAGVQRHPIKHGGTDIRFARSAFLSAIGVEAVGVRGVQPAGDDHQERNSDRGPDDSRDSRRSVFSIRQTSSRWRSRIFLAGARAARAGFVVVGARRGNAISRAKQKLKNPIKMR